jgi:5-methylcytosine-specific restriction endonuclease McrA
MTEYQHAYRKKHAEHIRHLMADWNRKNVAAKREHTRRRRAKLRAGGGSLSKDIVKKLLAAQRNRCACCKTDLLVSGLHLDHVLPLAKDGENVDTNMQLLCPPCNLSKSAKHPVDFMRSRGYLL